MSYYCKFFAVLLLFFYQASGSIINRRGVRQAEYSDCRTPNGTPGRCVLLKQCPLIFELLKIVQALEKDNYNFLKQSSCGKSGEYPPKVCCNLNTMTSDTPTPPPNVPTEATESEISGRTPSSEPLSDNDPNIYPPTTTDYSVCGKTDNKVVRIQGGQNATLGAWPWIVALGYRNGGDPTKSWVCGGSLISDRWVLTAGHCTIGIGSLKLTTARMGDLHLDENVDDGASPIDIEVEIIIPHPQFRSSPVTNDIALLRLKSPVTFTKYIRPICIPSTELHKSDEFYAGKSPFVAGWGHTRFGGTGSKLLQETRVDIVNQDVCAESYKKRQISPIDIRTLCASRKETDACQGDSGGPLILPSKAVYYLAGIVSYGVGCADPNFPGVYTRVAYYSDWVRSVTGIKI